jgi:hypothetical protein
MLGCSDMAQPLPDYQIRLSNFVGIAGCKLSTEPANLRM